ncbi:MAG TPA: gliding motility-associated C-terminal domain-containing protein, partial [Bacteroidales bacterium]
AGQCAATATLDIATDNQIPSTFAAIGPLCLNAAAPALPATSIEGFTGAWSPATISTSALGTITYTFTPAAGQCAATATLMIVISGPVITDIPTTNSTDGLANGQALVISMGDTPPLTYSLNGTAWQTSNVFNNLLAGTYTAWVQNANGCQTSRQFTILNTVTGKVEVIAESVLSCISVQFQIPVTAKAFTNISSFTIQLAFDPSALEFQGLSQTNSLLNPSLTPTVISPGILQITFTSSGSVTLPSGDRLFNLNFYGLSSGNTALTWNSLQCVIYSASGEIPAIYTQGSVEIRPAPHPQISDQDTLCSDQAIVLNAGQGFASYRWQDGSTEPNLTANTEGHYWVVVTDNNGCQGIDSVMLSPCENPRSYELQIFMPNAFSPNNDGTNDEFLAIYDREVSISFSMMVFNKWGEQIFSSNDITKGWDGTFKGVPCQPDLYTWIVSFMAPSPYYFKQTSPMLGTVMLLK